MRRIAILAIVALTFTACSNAAVESQEQPGPSTTIPTTTTAAIPSTTAGTIPPTTTAEPLWKQTNQETWWYAASIHADNTPLGTPMWAREVWDDIVRIDPDAPMDIRPFWGMKTGGRSPLSDDFYDEIRERTEAGYRVLYTLKDENASPDDLRRDVEEMARREALPWGVGLWNELAFGGKITPEEFSDRMTDVDLAGELEALHHEFGVMVTPPGIASFTNIVLNGYGEVIRDLFADRDGVFIKVHSYGHVQPKYWVELDLKTRVRTAIGMPDAVVIIEETANTFVGEGQKPRPGVGDERGAEFMRAAMYAGMQSEMPTLHFMLYHEWSDWNDISDPEEGKLRREAATEVLDWVRETNDNDPPDSMVLANPRGKEIDVNDYLP